MFAVTFTLNTAIQYCGLDIFWTKPDTWTNRHMDMVIPVYPTTPNFVTRDTKMTSLKYTINRQMMECPDSNVLHWYVVRSEWTSTCMKMHIYKTVYETFDQRKYTYFSSYLIHWWVNLSHYLLQKCCKCKSLLTQNQFHH